MWTCSFRSAAVTSRLLLTHDRGGGATATRGRHLHTICEQQEGRGGGEDERMGNEERRWEKMKQMKWSEEGRKREEKYKIAVRAEETNWVFQAGANISLWPGTSSLDVQGATPAAHCLATGWRSSLWEKHQKHRALSQQLWCRRYAVILMSPLSSPSRADGAPDGRSAPRATDSVSDVQLCSRSSVLQVATNRNCMEPGFNPDPPVSVTE